jgi:hypothetical protein
MAKNPIKTPNGPIQLSHFIDAIDKTNSSGGEKEARLLRNGFIRWLAVVAVEWQRSSPRAVFYSCNGHPNQDRNNNNN